MDSTSEIVTNDLVDIPEKATTITTASTETSDGSNAFPIESRSLSQRTGTGHNLLANTHGSNIRRGSYTHTTRLAVERTSLSLPAPIGKSCHDRRLSASISAGLAPRRSEDSTRNTTSTSPPASVKSFDDRLEVQFPRPPPATTSVTDTTVIMTSSQGQSAGPPVLSATSTSDGPSSTLEAQASSGPSPVDLSASAQDLFGPAKAEGSSLDGAFPARTPRTSTPRSTSVARRLSRTASKETDVGSNAPSIGKIGVCALDIKARSRPSRQILTRLQKDDEFEVIVFGDKVILDEDVENWPICDFLIAFFSDGFPIDKAIAYWKLRKPFLVNDLHMQKVLWDRRLCLMILDQMKVNTPRRLEITRDGGPRFESSELAQHVRRTAGIRLPGPEDGTGGGVPSTKTVEVTDDGDTLLIDGQAITKPFVEKPVSGEDHNVIIYFSRKEGGGARRLFRKIGNKSSEYEKDLITPRGITEPTESYIYEQFLKVENAEDVKAYTVGPYYCHAETRKSPVVDGLVRRNTHGKELRYVTHLTDSEKQMAARISKGFGQRICGFDLLRADKKSFVIDVNGWSFVKDNEDYYNDCARILKAMFVDWKATRSDGFPEDVSLTDVPTDAKNGYNNHRSTLKTILKSPSMHRLSAHLPHPRHHDSTGGMGRMAGGSAPSISPPGLEADSGIQPRLSNSLDSGGIMPIALSAEPSTESEAEPALEEKPVPMPSSKHSWKLKGVVAVIRHADRTPKQKIKFTAHSQVFVELLKGHHEEVLLKGEAALSNVQAAIKKAIDQKLEDTDKLRNLQNALNRKIGQPDTKIQIKPMFRKRKSDESPFVSQPSGHEDRKLLRASKSPPAHVRNDPLRDEPLARTISRSDSISNTTFSRFAAQEEDLVIDKMQLVMKWGGEPTHSARYQSGDLGANMRDDWKLLNRNVLDDVRVFTSSEKRVKTSAHFYTTAFVDQQDIPNDFIQVRKDLLDDSNAAKDVMDKVKKKLKHLLREGNSVPEQFAWPNDVPEPYIVMQNVVDLLNFHRRVMRHNFKKLQTGAAASLQAISSPDSNASDKSDSVDSDKIQARWCTGEDAELFRERWEKLFKEFCDAEKADPSKISELYDTMKYDALHNKPFLEWVFTPSQSVIDEINKEEGIGFLDLSPEAEQANGASDTIEDAVEPAKRPESTISFSTSTTEKSHSSSLASKFTNLTHRRKSVLAQPPSTPPLASYEQDASYFKLFRSSSDSRSKVDKRLGRLRELYRYAKVLFDYICPQEYGISDEEKLEIGLLTSLPLLREIVQDLEELQASSNSASFIYFTKESHIYTLLNCIMEGGIHTKIPRRTIPELDYLSQICFELYEARDVDTSETEYSIRIAISPGCHTIDPLDVSLDSKHAIGTAPRRSLTDHQDWKEVITTLKAKFGTVQLPKSFLAVNVSGMHEEERRASKAEAEKLSGSNGLGEALEEERGRTQHIAVTTPAAPQAIGEPTIAEDGTELGRLTSLQNVGGRMRTE